MKLVQEQDGVHTATCARKNAQALGFKGFAGKLNIYEPANLESADILCVFPKTL